MILIDDDDEDEDVEAAEDGVEPVELFDCINFDFLLDDDEFLLCLFDFELAETGKLLFG